MKRFIFIIITAITFLLGYSQEYIASVKGSTDWNRFEDASMKGYAVSFKNVNEPSLGLQVIAFKNGHFDIDSSPLGQYMTGNGTVLVQDTILPSFYVGRQKFDNVPYIKRKAKMQGVFTNIEIWQVHNEGVEYSIIGISPVKKNQILLNCVTSNLKLLPLPSVNEDEFIATVKSVNDMMAKVGGGKMSDEILMISAKADKEKKEFIRTYKIIIDAEPDEITDFTSRDNTYSKVAYEAENTPLVKNAIELGYALVVVWTDINGKEIISHNFNF